MSQPSLLQNAGLEAITRRVEHTCPNCGHQELLVFYEVRNVPVHSCLMLSSQQEALDFPCGDVVLGFVPVAALLPTLNLMRKNLLMHQTMRTNKASRQRSTSLQWTWQTV